ncbi:MAG: Tfp pilus assembly protein FimT/FimU [Verrucomicrobiota bacterium]
MSPTGRNPAPAADPRRAGFTLIELILVMAMLVVVLALVAPSLGNFFRGRAVDSEARRLLSLTRYAESRAVAEGVPMLLWLNPAQRAYGLVAEFSYAPQDPRERQYAVDRDVRMEVTAAPSFRQTQDPLLPARQQAAVARFGRDASVIRFQADGFLSEGAPEAVGFSPEPRDGSSARPGPAASTWVARTVDGLRYAIPTNQLADARR